MVYATVEDLKAIWPAFPTGKEATAEALLDDAAVRIDAYAPPPGPLTVEQLAVRRTVSREMVKFVMANEPAHDPDVASMQRSMGPFSEGITYRTERTLMLTDEHKGMLRSRAQIAFTVPMVAEHPPTDPLWWLQ
ncbi:MULTISPECIES: hypothetical protein [unclassified Agrococcus]|uniref:hypothetical protein n=1 Tax=unclassified Agrococcus TaxID=2615065 RepID=UPI003606D174